jgi:putative phosphoribosyl transferase
MIFKNRQEAGRKLAEKLSAYKDKDVVVLALPRGGVPVGFEIARALHLPLDVLIVRKLGVPGYKELAMGAIASGGVRVVNRGIVLDLKISEGVIDLVATEEEAELKRRERLYRGERPPLEVRGKTVILVDDGVATGATMRAGVVALRQLKPERLIVAVPTAAPDTYAELAREVDEVIALTTPEPYIAVGVWFRDFPQVGDEEVQALLEEAAQPRLAASS